MLSLKAIFSPLFVDAGEEALVFQLFHAVSL